MKVILLINSLYTGGAEFSTLTFYSWVKSIMKDEVKIICLKKADPEYDFREFGFEEVTYLNQDSFFSRLKNFNRIVDEFRPDIVHSVLFDANLIGRASRMIKRDFKHLESLVNQTYSPYRLKDPNVNKLKLEVYRCLDFIMQIWGVDYFHSNGATVAKHYQEKLFIDPTRITNIPRGRYPNPFLNDTEKINLFRSKLKLEDKIVLINVARHEYQKAQTVLIDALNELNDLKSDYILLLVGRNGEATKEIQEKINLYGLQENVRILGHRSDVTKLLAASDIFVFPSRFEGLPGALIEAEAAGLPIVCSDIPNNKEVIEENSNALIFPVDNSKILAEKLRELILQTEKREYMKKRSLSIYEKKFKIEKVHHQLYDLMKALL
jgi:glycosyltransferase involved in cell wall biosynthesis